MDQLNLLPCPVLVTDAMGHVIGANTDLLNLVGGSTADWQLRPMSDLFPPASRIFLQTHVWPMLLRQSSVREIHLQLFDVQLQRIPVLVNCQHGLFNGVESYFWVFFVALERSRFETALLQARSDAQHMSANLALAHRELESLHSQLTQRTGVVETENRTLTDLSQTDPLTGMANRRALTIDVARWQAQAETHACASLLLVDVDHFKAVNDQHGHDEGDRVLIDLAHKLQLSMRLSDLAVRYGGEEFVMWLPLADRLGAGYTAQRVHDNVRQVLVAGKPITVSIGIATATNQLGTELLSQLTQHADRAVYQAKAAGRHCTLHFE